MALPFIQKSIIVRTRKISWAAEKHVVDNNDDGVLHLENLLKFFGFPINVTVDNKRKITTRTWLKSHHHFVKIHYPANSTKLCLMT